jgi:ABC-2 type transport system ATP-binding protein
MLQRVGIAQALVNDPEVVFFDEPMSGLDPLGRREIRHLILGLRDRGCTVFFSSHVLSDAEALCNRVAIVAAGRLVAAGDLSELLALRVRGWELVLSGVPRDALDRMGAGVTKVTPLGGDRYTLELPLSPPPEQVLAALVAQGASLVSLNPIRDTLEDLFVRRVATATTDRGLANPGPPDRRGGPSGPAAS